MLAKIADVGDVPIEHRYHLDEGIRDIEKYYHQVMDAGVIPLTAGGDHSNAQGHDARGCQPRRPRAL